MAVDPPAPSHATEPSGPPRRGPVRSPRDLLAGASLVAVAAFAYWKASALDPGNLRAMGPGMLPRLVAAALGGAGLLLAGWAFVRRGPGVGRWPLRGPIFVCLGVLAFAVTIRTVGLLVAGPAVVLVGGAATPEVRPKELVVFAVVMTAACAGLFRFVLGLPIPILYLFGVTI